MATIMNRNGKWQALVRIKGQAARTKSLAYKAGAGRWVRQTEADLEATAFRVGQRALDRATKRGVLDAIGAK